VGGYAGIIISRRIAMEKDKYIEKLRDELNIDCDNCDEMCARDGECIESCKVTPLTDYIYTQSKELESVRSAVDEEMKQTVL
jgi:hypothetical protein